MANFIKVDKDFNQTKRRNFYAVEIFQSFVWMFFHFTVVHFFMIKMESLALIGIFLWFGNFIAFLVDSPIWVLQRYFKAKTLFKTWWYLVLAVSLIFVYFTFSADTVSFEWIKLFSKEAIDWLFGSAFNIFLLLLSVIFYWIIKELNEVTSNSYVMEHADPSQYAEMFSKRSIFSWAWACVWIVLSWVILALSPFVAAIFLMIIALTYTFFTEKFMDNSTDEINLDAIKQIKLIRKIRWEKWKEEYKSEVINNKEELKEKTEWKSTIFLKSSETKWKIKISELWEWTLADIKTFWKIVFERPLNEKLLIIWAVFVLFWCWDNFVTTFLIDYIDDILSANSQELAKYKLQNVLTAYICVWLFCIPAYWWQIPIVKIAQHLWPWKVMIPGLILAWLSMFIIAFSDGLYVLFLAWVLNWLGYAACLPLSQWEFTNEYNITYSTKNNLKQIDTNASAAPLKMLANLANVVWLAFGWIMLQIFNYTGTFILLWLVIIAVLILVIKDWKKVQLW